MAAPSSGSADVETRCRLPLAVAAKPGLLAYWLWTFRDDSRRVAGPSEEPMAERRVDEPGLRLIGRGGARDGRSQRRRGGWRVASRRVARFADARTRGGIRLRYRARRKRSRETQAMAGASRHGSRGRSWHRGAGSARDRRRRRATRCGKRAHLERDARGCRDGCGVGGARQRRRSRFFFATCCSRGRGVTAEMGKQRRTRSASARAPHEKRRVNTAGKTNARVAAVLDGRVARARPSTGKIFPVS